MDTKSYLKFDKKLMINLEYSLYRNILRTNRRGAYQNSSISGCNTSKYQGLLVMPVPFLDNDNHVILSSFDETVIQHGAEFNLGIHKYSGDNFSPKGHKYIREFNCDSIPKTVYRVGGVILSKEILFSSKENRLMIRYTLLDAHSPTTIRFKPFLAFRNIFQLTRENDQVDKSYREIENGISTSMYYGYPELFMQFNKSPQFVYHPDWYRGIEYLQDMQSGDTYIEDLYVPGYFEMAIKKGESIVFSAADILANPSNLPKQFDIEIHTRTPRSNFYNCLKNSSHQFYYIPQKNEYYLLAGYPWFKVRARDLFISLPGCTLSVERNKEFEYIMDTAITHLKDFMQGKLSKNVIHEIDAPDVLLWVIWALQQFWKTQKDIFQEKYTTFTLFVLDYIQSNAHPNLSIDEQTGLLSTFGKDRVVSWMNAEINGQPVIPRSGFLVEFNALWYNALMFVKEIADYNENKKLSDKIGEQAAHVKTAFIEKFMNDAGYLYDYVDGYYVDWDVRPNMLFAVSLNYSPLNRKQKRSVIDYVTKELLTPVGIRSLSPKSDKFHPYHTGNNEEKEYAYFNGTAFPWLLGAYIEGYLRIFQMSGLSLMDRIMVGLEDEMSNNCVGTLNEFYDSSPPFFGKGAYSFAMSVAEVLRAKKLINAFG